MGRYYYSKKQEADGLKTLDVHFLKKHGYLTADEKWGSVNYSINGEPTGSISIRVKKAEHSHNITLIYTQTDNNTGEKKDFNYKNEIVSIPCHFGGVRHYFICGLSKSGVYCGRRVAKLYKGGDYFGCRHCYELTYSSRKDNKQFRGLARMFAIEKKIEKLEARTKRRMYAGKPTRQYRKLQYLYSQEDNIGADEFIRANLYNK